MPAYNSIAVTTAQQIAQVPTLIKGLPVRVWDVEGFNGNATPWFIQGCSGRGIGTASAQFPSNNTAASTIVAFISIFSLSAISDPTVSDIGLNTYTKTGTSTAQTQCYVYMAPNVAAGANTITVSSPGNLISITAGEYGGTPTTSVSDATPTFATAGFSLKIDGSITTATAKDLVVAGYYNAMGREGFPSYPFVRRNYFQAADRIAIMDGPARVAGAQPLTVKYSGGDNVTLMMAALKAGTITASPNVFSQQVCLPDHGKFTKSFAVDLAFSANPGVFQIDIQTADIDNPTQYVTRQSITSGLNASFIGRTEVTGVAANYARLVLVSLTNAVTVTANIFG